MGAAGVEAMAPAGAAAAASSPSRSTGTPRSAATRATSAAVRSSSAARATRGAACARARVTTLVSLSRSWIEQPVVAEASDELVGAAEDGGAGRRDAHRLSEVVPARLDLRRVQAELLQAEHLHLGAAPEN